jgi:glycosyltransferase involved in cell wall biosynthesis
MKSEKDKEIYSLDNKFSTTQLLVKEMTYFDNDKNAKLKSTFFHLEIDEKTKCGGLRCKGFFKKSFPDKPLFTMITGTFNSEKYLEETIQSVINQSYKNIEYIIVDGASTDRTIDIVKKYDNKIDYWISEKDKGIYNAMNKGITLASGDIIGIINSDDWLESYAIEQVADVSKKIPEKDFVIHGKIAIYDSEKNFLGTHGPKKIPGYFLFSTPFKHPAMFVSKKLYKRIGLYDETIGLAADYDMMLRIIKDKNCKVFLNKVLTNVRKVGISTGGYSRSSNRDLIKIIKRNTGSRLLAFFSMGIRLINRWIKS